jgi:DNA-binding NtrC family response regulator
MQTDGLKNKLFFTTLVIDSKLSVTGILEDFLKADGHFIMQAESAEMARSKTRRFQPDLILLNSELTGIHGLELLSELLMEQPTASVIIMASNPSVRDVVEAMQQGAVDFLKTPLKMEDLSLAVASQRALFKLGDRLAA